MSRPPTTSTTLLRELAADSQHARWGEFVTRYEPMMRDYLRVSMRTMSLPRRWSPWWTFWRITVSRCFLKFKGKKIQKASYRSLFNYFRWFLLTVGFGVFASASGTSNHGKVEQVEETDAEMQQVQSANGSSPESGDAGGRNSEQVEMHE